MQDTLFGCARCLHPTTDLRRLHRNPAVDVGVGRGMVGTDTRLGDGVSGVKHRSGAKPGPPSVRRTSCSGRAGSERESYPRRRRPP